MAYARSVDAVQGLQLGGCSVQAVLRLHHLRVGGPVRVHVVAVFVVDIALLVHHRCQVVHVGVVVHSLGRRDAAVDCQELVLVERRVVDYVLEEPGAFPYRFSVGVDFPYRLVGRFASLGVYHVQRFPCIGVERLHLVGDEAVPGGRGHPGGALLYLGLVGSDHHDVVVVGGGELVVVVELLRGR